MTWWQRPDLEEAFLEGYGRDLSDDERELIRRLAAFKALGNVGWAAVHGNAAFEAIGRRTLAWQQSER